MSHAYTNNCPLGPHFSLLSADVLMYEILSKLDVRALVDLQLTCKSFIVIARHDHLWKRHFHKTFARLRGNVEPLSYYRSFCFYAYTWNKHCKLVCSTSCSLQQKSAVKDFFSQTKAFFAYFDKTCYALPLEWQRRPAYWIVLARIETRREWTDEEVCLKCMQRLEENDWRWPFVPRKCAAGCVHNDDLRGGYSASEESRALQTVYQITRDYKPWHEYRS